MGEMLAVKEEQDVLANQDWEIYDEYIEDTLVEYPMLTSWEEFEQLLADATSNQDMETIQKLLRIEEKDICNEKECRKLLLNLCKLGKMDEFDENCYVNYQVEEGDTPKLTRCLPTIMALILEEYEIVETLIKNGFPICVDPYDHVSICMTLSQVCHINAYQLIACNPAFPSELAHLIDCHMEQYPDIEFLFGKNPSTFCQPKPKELRRFFRDCPNYFAKLCKRILNNEKVYELKINGFEYTLEVQHELMQALQVTPGVLKKYLNYLVSEATYLNLENDNKWYQFESRWYEKEQIVESLLKVRQKEWNLFQKLPDVRKELAKVILVDYLLYSEPCLEVCLQNPELGNVYKTDLLKKAARFIWGDLFWTDLLEIANRMILGKELHIVYAYIYQIMKKRIQIKRNEDVYKEMLILFVNEENNQTIQLFYDAIQIEPMAESVSEMVPIESEQENEMGVCLREIIESWIQFGDLDVLLASIKNGLFLPQFREYAEQMAINHDKYWSIPILLALSE